MATLEPLPVVRRLYLQTPSRKQQLVLLLIILLGIALRLYQINHSLDVDEVFSVRVASSTFSHLVRATIADRTHPPLYGILLYLWLKATGPSEAAARLLTALISLVFLLVLSQVAFKLTRGFAAWFIVSFCAVSGYFVYYGQEARPYALAGLFCIFSIWCLLKIQEDPGNWKYKALYALSCFALMWTQYVGVLFLLSQFAAVWFGRFRQKRAILLWGLVGTISVIPWILMLRTELRPSVIRANIGWITKPSWQDFWHPYVSVFGRLPIAHSTAILLLASVLAVMSLLVRARDSDRNNTLLVGCTALLPLAAAFVISHYGPVSIWTFRQFIGPVVMTVCLLGLGLAAHRRPLGLALGGFFLAWCVFGLPNWFRNNMTQPWNVVAQTLKETCARCEVEVPDVLTQIALSYYTGQPVRSIDAHALTAKELPSLVYWLPSSPSLEPETDRVLFLCRPSQCGALDSFLTRHRVANRRRITWGRSRQNAAPAIDVYLLEKY